jgi:hypothetical protein
VIAITAAINIPATTLKKFIGYLPVLDDVSPQRDGAINCGMRFANRQIAESEKVGNTPLLPLIDPMTATRQTVSWNSRAKLILKQQDKEPMRAGTGTTGRENNNEKACHSDDSHNQLSVLPSAICFTELADAQCAGRTDNEPASRHPVQGCCRD